MEFNLRFNLHTAVVLYNIKAPKHPRIKRLREAIAPKVVVLGLALFALTMPAMGSGKAITAIPFFDVIHIDIIPQYTGQASALFKAYQLASLKDGGAIRVDILQQIGLLNHFTVIEEWENQSAYEKHIASAHMRNFRADLSPLLGSPYDERPHQPGNYPAP